MTGSSGRRRTTGDNQRRKAAVPAAPPTERDPNRSPQPAAPAAPASPAAASPGAVAPPATAPPPAVSPIHSERLELLAHLEAMLEPIMMMLGLLFLGLFAFEYSGVDFTPLEKSWIDRAETTIYWVFAGDFIVRFAIAPAKIRFLRTNWITALSLALPALRPLRAVGAAGSLSTVHLLRLLSGANHGMRALRHITRGRQFAYLVSLTFIVTLLSAGGVLFFERNARDANITDASDAIWWAATLVTTINSNDDPVSFPGRIIGLLLRIYAVSVLGFITASIASYLIGHAMEPTESTAHAATPAATGTSLHQQLAGLRDEVRSLREELAARGRERSGDQPEQTPASRD
ncbi:MAG: ion transporter [Gemmatimonadota bacterium]|nr:ion transporter [Gemmatimonadota bacterium]